MTSTVWGSLGIYAPLIALVAVGGLTTGFLAGLFGIGGGGILVPILYEVFGILGVDPSIRMHMAVGTSLAIIFPTSLMSLRAHSQRGGVDVTVIQRLALPVLAGVGIGILVAASSPGAVLKWIWIVFAVFIASKQFFGKDTWRLGADIPKSKLVEVYAVGVGFLSTMMSIGGGAFITMLMTLYGRSLRQGIGTSSGFGPLIAVPGMIGFMWAGWTAMQSGLLPAGSIGFVNLPAVALVTPLSVFTVPFGARVAHGVSKRTLEIGFGCFLLLVASRFAIALAY